MEKTSNLVRIVYVSTATELFSENELQQILEISRRNNETRNITGLLLYSAGNILQVLEGDPDVLAELYGKISQDHRHFGIIQLQRSSITQRMFTEWSMGFKSISNSEFNEAKGYLDLRGKEITQITNADEAIKDILDMFLAHNK